MRLWKLMVVVSVFASCSRANLASNVTIDRKDEESTYFANQVVQAQAPTAFALQPESQTFVAEVENAAFVKEHALIARIQADPSLVAAIADFPNLEWGAKEVILRRIFTLEVDALQIQAPELQIANGIIRGSAFFKFELTGNSPGTVILNPEAIQKEQNPYLALLLMIHETRHSAQLQLTQAQSSSAPPALHQAYRAAFQAQKQLQIRSFSDFLTLNNEYEAFRFANYVVGSLTGWHVSTLGLGTYASQFTDGGVLRIDLANLFDQKQRGEFTESVLEKFNAMEQEQYELLHPTR